MLRGSRESFLSSAVTQLRYAPSNPNSVKELLQQSIVEGFVEWMINERNIQTRSFKSSLGMIFAVVRYHSSFRDGGLQLVQVAARQHPG
jgi:hypothetical protein